MERMTSAEEANWTLERQITQDSIDAYAGVAGDFNPIHVNPEAALKTTFGGTIAHGFFVLSFGSVLLTRLFGRRWVEGGSMKVKFRRAAKPGDRITVRAFPKEVVQEEGCSFLTLNLVWENQARETVIEGNARVPE
jgi:acyl dehydratase